MWPHLITIIVIVGQMGPEMGILGIRGFSEVVGSGESRQGECVTLDRSAFSVPWFAKC